MGELENKKRAYIVELAIRRIPLTYIYDVFLFKRTLILDFYAPDGEKISHEMLKEFSSALQATFEFSVNISEPWERKFDSANGKFSYYKYIPLRVSTDGFPNNVISPKYCAEEESNFKLDLHINNVAQQNCKIKKYEKTVTYYESECEDPSQLELEGIS
jgi:hypothetical protein